MGDEAAVVTRDAAIVGVAEAVSPTGVLDLYGRELEAAMVREALADAGLMLADVDGISYRIEGSFDLQTYDAVIEEVVPALDSGLPVLNPGWEYRSFRHVLDIEARDQAVLRVAIGQTSL